MNFSVIIAAWNEGAQIDSSLKRLRQISSPGATEIIVVDGNSSDDTVEQARRWADQIIVWEQANAGAQFDAGAKKATGDLLVFLRPDLQLSGNWQQVLEHYWLTEHLKPIAATAFSVDYGSSFSLRLTSMLANSSLGWRSLVAGDHGLCTTPEIYRKSGGYPPLPYGEDWIFSKRLSRHGEVRLLKERIRPAARRMHQLGLFKYMFKQAWWDLLFELGVSPDKLWRRYRGL
ncbi:MAG: hypothetical protein A3J74_11020 [Elusimicrobia bacterium RIFCSPHIGHO2_02_FULL_57_9]|nr:MAG: hypothetical protein A3J74_11020 [Elusimicrobia bacterium RIFCSPHIGHO2_02_FULL_57_9]